MGDKVNDLPRLDKAQRDVVMLGIATAAIILFVGIGGGFTWATSLWKL